MWLIYSTLIILGLLKMTKNEILTFTVEFYIRSERIRYIKDVEFFSRIKIWNQVFPKRQIWAILAIFGNYTKGHVLDKY